MSTGNGEKQQEPAPDRIEVQATMDLKAGTATFTEKKVNGVIMLDPKTIVIPIQTLMIMGAQALLAMNGISTGGAVRVTKEGATEQQDKRIITS
jgi:hypothetical protein